MTDTEKAMMIMEITNQGADLEKHQRLVVQSALSGELAAFILLVRNPQKKVL